MFSEPFDEDARLSMHSGAHLRGAPRPRHPAQRVARAALERPPLEFLRVCGGIGDAGLGALGGVARRGAQAPHGERAEVQAMGSRACGGPGRRPRVAEACATAAVSLPSSSSVRCSHCSGAGRAAPAQAVWVTSTTTEPALSISWR